MGVIGKSHIVALREASGAQLSAVADVNVKEARRVGSEHKVKWYADHVEMLEKEELDIASICVPHFLHEKIARDVAKHGVNVILEKPVAMRIKEADRIIDEAKKKGVKLGVVFQHRFRPSVRAAERLTKGGLKPLFRFILEYAVFRGSGYYSSGPWRGTWAGEGGGVLINQGIHFIDLLQFLVGSAPSRTFATASTIAHRIEVEDVASAVVEFRDGVQGVMQFTTIDAPQTIRLEIRGNGGVIALDQSQVQASLSRIPLKRQVAGTSGMFESPKAEWRLLAKDKAGLNYHALFYKDFLEAIREDRDPLISGEEGRKSLELANAVIYSAVHGRPVRHPLDPDRYEQLFRELTVRKSF